MPLFLTVSLVLPSSFLKVVLVLTLSFRESQSYYDPLFSPESKFVADPLSFPERTLFTLCQKRLTIRTKSTD